jgi:hypothetical protein
MNSPRHSLIRRAAAAATFGTLLAAFAALPVTQARAWWVGAPAVVVAPPAVVVAPPAYYSAPPAVVYAPPPPYYYGRPHRVWVPGHWNGPYWVPPHWA